MSRRILQIVETLNPAGVGSQVLTLAEGLAADEFEVHVATMGSDGDGTATWASRLETAGISPTKFNARLTFDPITLCRLTRLVRRLQPHLVHTCGPLANALGRTAALTAGIKTMVVSRPRSEIPQSMIETRLDRLLNTRTQQTIVTTDAVRDECLASGLKEDAVTLIPCGIPIAKESGLSREEVLRRLELPEGSWLIGAIGPLLPEERLKELLWVSQLENVLHENIRLVVFGEGPQRDVLDRYVRLLDGEEYIRLPGDRDDLPEMLPHFDLLWHTASYVSQPAAILQAMAAGVPVVASDMAGHRDLVVPGETGLLVPAGIRRSWAKATERIYHDKELARRMGEQGRQRVLGEFPSEQMIERHVMLYRELLDG